jgi:DNA ligase-1
MEVLGAEITFSPIHTCAFGELRKDAGLAIRFPRFTGTWREDKSPEQATTTSEIVNMYKAQLKHME